MNDTICGIVTANGIAGVGIIRISGDRCLEIATKILKKPLKPRYAHYGNFYQNKEVIDKGIAIYFSAPNSFTGENILELQAHGGRVVLNNILQSVIDCGARLAEAGEFSKRAFLNGKIDLVQAEAIADIISSTSSQASKLALNSLRGEFSKKINNLRQKIIELRTFVEATIDFVDEEIDFIADNKVAIKINKIIHTLNDILISSKQGAILRDGINIAIIGKPNAGKSSLLNALTKEDSAIVTSIAGTTRDIIKEQITINGIPINIIDTAGIHDSFNEVEKIGINLARIEGKKADIVLLVFESGETPDLSLIEFDKQKIILVQNKIDIYDVFTDGAIKISAKNKIGIQKLNDKILETIGLNSNLENINLARMRHIEELKQAFKFTKNAQKRLTGMEIELVADDLTYASKHLGRITGEFSSDDLLGEIFSSFCIGK